MPKKLLFWILVIFGILAATQLFAALPGWVSWVYQTVHYGIWSPNKASQNVLPDLLITASGVVAVNPLSGATVTNTDFKKWDIVAQRYCFEGSKECVETFQQSFSNNQNYSVVLSDIIYEDQNCTVKATDRSKPFFICINPATIATIGLDPSNATGSVSNWFTIASSPVNAWGNYAKQLWIEYGSSRFNSPVDFVDGANDDIYDRVATGSIISGPARYVFRGCYVDRFVAGVKTANSILDNDFARCSNLNAMGTPSATWSDYKADYITYCDVNKNHCWALRFEIRMTAGPNATYYDYTQCFHVPYAGILRGGKATDVFLTSIESTQFESAPTNYNPAFCGNWWSMYSQIQIRFLLVDALPMLSAQSLEQYATTQNAKMYIKSLGVMWLK